MAATLVGCQRCFERCSGWFCEHMVVRWGRRTLGVWRGNPNV